MPLYIKYYGSYTSVRQKLLNVELKVAQVIEACLYGDKKTDAEMISRLCAYMAVIIIHRGGQIGNIQSMHTLWNPGTGG